MTVINEPEIIIHDIENNIVEKMKNNEYFKNISQFISQI
jgi:hypothetical protein